LFVYYTLVAILLVLAGPLLLLAPKRRAGLAAKLGFLPDSYRAASDTKAENIWFHAVSVGEFNAVWPLIEAYRTRHAGERIWISTATETAQKLAGERAAGLATVFYFPLDLPFAIRPWLALIRPRLVVIAETEIWPGFTHECTRAGVPVVVVNGRISSRSLPSYKRFAFLFSRVIGQFAAVAAQSEIDAGRYREIAGPHVNVVATGNLKFDGLEPLPEAEQAELRSALNLSAAHRVLVAGSTHEGEEKAVLDAHAHLLALAGADRADSRYRLVIAPRHPERFDHVAELIESCGFRARRYSKGERLETACDVYLLDTIGKLFAHYSLAHLAFVGGTLAPIGGHNLLEPYAYSVPVVAGPSLDKTLDVARGLKEREALTVVPDAGALSERVAALFADDELRLDLGRRGKLWLNESEGAVARTLKVVEAVLDHKAGTTPGGAYNTGVFSEASAPGERAGPSGD